MRNRRLAAVAVTASLAALTGLAQAVPAFSPAPAAAAVEGGTGGPPPPPGNSYAHAVYSTIQIDGNPTPPGINTGHYHLPPCWLEPRFTGGQSWQPGDPVALTSSGDADEYWWWFAQQEPNFAPIPQHDPGGERAINHSFKKEQGNDGWWWVPSWLDVSGGSACAFGLVSSLGLNNGFLDFATPQGATPPGGITPQRLRFLARAALILPKIRIHTNPPRRMPSDVNLPVWVWVTYTGPRQPWASASVQTPNGQLSATVTTSAPTVSITASTSNIRVYNRCGATGSRYHSGNGTPPCGLTFYAPSTSGPYTLTVTATWKIFWQDSTPAQGQFAQGGQATASELVTVREIQAINGPGGSGTSGG
jgi:hypothetical protein